jgi:hypothetical protein
MQINSNIPSAWLMAVNICSISIYISSVCVCAYWEKNSHRKVCRCHSYSQPYLKISSARRCYRHLVVMQIWLLRHGWVIKDCVITAML